MSMYPVGIYKVLIPGLGYKKLPVPGPRYTRTQARPPRLALVEFQAALPYLSRSSDILNYPLRSKMSNQATRGVDGMLTHIEAKLTEGMHAPGRPAGALTTPGVPNIPRYARSERAGRLRSGTTHPTPLPHVAGCRPKIYSLLPPSSPLYVLFVCPPSRTH